MPSSKNVPYKFHHQSSGYELNLRRSQNLLLAVQIEPLQPRWAVVSCVLTVYFLILRLVYSVTVFGFLKSPIIRGHIFRTLHQTVATLHLLPPLKKKKKQRAERHLSSSIRNFFFMTVCLNVYNLPFGSFVFVLVYLAIPRPGLGARLTDSL